MSKSSFVHSIMVRFRDLGAVAGYKKLNQQVAAYKRQTSAARGAIGKMGRASIGLAAAAAGIGSVAAAGSSVGRLSENFLDAATAMNELEVRSKATKEEMAELVGLSAKLAGETIFTQPEISNAMKLLGARGMGVTEIKAMIGRIAATATAEPGTTLPDMTEMLVAAMNQFGFLSPKTLSSDPDKKIQQIEERLARVSDAMFIAGNETSAGIADLSIAFRMFAQQANLMNISIERSAAAAGVLANVGLPPEMGGTALRNILQRVMNPTHMARLRKGGIDTSQFIDRAGNFMGIPAVLRTIRDSSDLLRNRMQEMLSLSEEEQDRLAASDPMLTTIMAAFEQRATGPLLALVSNIERFEEVFEKIGSEDIMNVARAQEIMMGRGRGAMEKVRAEWSKILIVLGDKFMPIMRFAREQMNLFGKAFNHFAEDLGIFTAKGMGSAKTSISRFVIAAAAGTAELLRHVKVMMPAMLKIAIPPIIMVGHAMVWAMKMTEKVAPVIYILGMAFEALLWHLQPIIKLINWATDSDMGDADEWGGDRFVSESQAKADRWVNEFMEKFDGTLEGGMERIAKRMEADAAELAMRHQSINAAEYVEIVDVGVAPPN